MVPGAGDDGLVMACDDDLVGIERGLASGIAELSNGYEGAVGEGRNDMCVSGVGW